MRVLVLDGTGMLGHRLLERMAPPGEKIHEIMVSEEELHHCVRRGDYFAIRSMLPELRAEAEPNALDHEFSSADGVLSYEGTLELLRKHRMTVEQAEVNTGELSR